MIAEPKQNILKILELIDYDGNKEDYALDLLSLVEKQAAMNLLETLLPDKKEILEKELSGGEDSISVLDKYFRPDQKGEAMKNASEAVMKDYLDEIVPTLSETQLTNLESYLKTLQA